MSSNQGWYYALIDWFARNAVAANLLMMILLLGGLYTVFTIKWLGGGARLQAGSTYANRGYYFNSELGNVKATADDLLTNTFVDEVGLELWSPRKVDVYQTGTNFVVMAASSARGTLSPNWM